MPLSPETLDPLSCTTVEFEYCHDRPLRALALRYVPRDRLSQHDSSRATCSLLMFGGLNLQNETWIPLIKQLYHCTSQPHSRVTVHSVWVIERPNHGDAALLNEAALKEHYSVIFPGMQYAAAIRTFLASTILSDVERSHLVAVAHSGAGSSVLRALEPATSNLPIARLMLVEAPLLDREHAWGPMQVLYKTVARSNARRKTSWSSVEEAMDYFKRRFPCKVYHPEVWQIMSETYFRRDPKDLERVTTKTTIEQETASFVDDGTHLEAFAYLRKIFHVLPTHIIMGEVEDLWTPELYHQSYANNERYRESLASISVIKGAGHYLPVQMPSELAAEMARLLDESVGKSPGLSARL